MKLNKKVIRTAAISASGAAMIVAAPGLADHAWNKYHWDRTTPEITVPIYDSTTGIWKQRNHVAIAVADWNQSEYIESPLANGNSDPSCPIVGGEINVCNDNYGSTGWVGIASITATRGRTTHITGGVTKLNDYYFDQSFYNNDTWRQLVTCQEIGHDYGLGHQNENFETDETDSCMEYTSDATNNTHPDQHDYDMINQIYAHSHTDGGGSGGSSGGKGNGKGKKLGQSGNGPADWGRAIGFDAKGRANVYKRSMDSFDIITHVTWAIGEGPDEHHHDEGPRRHKGERVFNH